MRVLVIMTVLGACTALPSLTQQVKWTGLPAATIPASVPGSSPNVADTSDVIAARKAFFTAYQSQLASVVPRKPAKWTGPLASDFPAGVPGSTPNVADTADVTAARAAFLNTYQRQVAATAVKP